MRARLDDLVASRVAEGAAVPALTCYDFTTALAVVAAAETYGRGVTLLVTPKTAAAADGLRFTRALRNLADSASVPVVVQLDHATDLDLILATVDAGADAVLADGSKLSFDDNAAFVAHVRDLTHGRGIVIEAELGSIEGDEDRAFAVAAASAGKTDPELVAPFVLLSGAHLLATSVGNVHGKYVGTPELDWPLIASIRSQSRVPLALHGASGLSDADLSRAITAGLGKININTELRGAILDALTVELPRSRDNGDDVLALDARWRDAAYEFALGALERLSPPSATTINLAETTTS